jgi:hypothetical protein
MRILRTEQFERSLAETIAWCGKLLSSYEIDSEAMRHRLSLSDQAARLSQEAYASAGKSWPRQNVTETKEWMDLKVVWQQLRAAPMPFEHVLRSLALKPAFDLDVFGWDAPRQEAVAQVVAEKSQLIGQLTPQIGAADEAGGRLLLYRPAENLACGAAEQSSHGFFDVNNVPPWDIWVDFSEGTLVSWVPPPLVQAAEAGIDANPEQCIQWAE